MNLFGHGLKPAMDFLDLPYTLFLDIVSYLSARDTIRCRCLCTRAYQAFTGQELCVSLIQTHFPRSLEGRLLRGHLRQDRHGAVDSRDWAAVFASLTRRYLHLGSATPWRTLKLETLRDEHRLRGVAPWDRFLRLDDRTANLHYDEAVWTLDPAEGLLVYPAPDGLGFQARDLGTGEQVEVPFELDGKVVRRARLKDGVLVLEWCEEQASHALNEREHAHRHFATAYDIRRTGGWDGVLPLRAAVDGRGGKTQQLSLWKITFRSEWKIHYLGLPLNAQDRFFSAHNATHYVVYIWQPPRSTWGEDEPLERLTVWELGEPSPYRPSLDPNDQHHPPAELAGPRVIRSLTNRELSTWGIRQSHTPSLRGLFLDESTWDARSRSACGHVFLHEEDHRWCAGPHSSATPPRLHRVRSTGIPLQGDGPRWVDDCGGSGGGGGDEAGLGFCWREPQRPGRRGGGGDEGAIDEGVDWPGRAPCWRHDDLPYLTVSEMFDSAAGVRVSARHCFMLETLSVHVRPKLRVAGADWGEGEGGEGARTGGTRIEGPDGDEVQFGDEWWGELLGKGYICGDERWLVGEDESGDITVLQF
ncbi:hypothetical protein ACO1O0_001101 [Amphichorda felina]